MEDNNIAHVPVDIILQESLSQRDRVVKEVMDKLYEKLPCAFVEFDFTLTNGTKCWIKKFHPPKKNDEGILTYGFDVKFDQSAVLSHLEFSVRCSGWERSLAPSKES